MSTSHPPRPTRELGLWVKMGLLQSIYIVNLFNFALSDLNETIMPLKHIATSGIHLNHVTVGKSNLIDHFGKNYVFFAFNSSVDSLISREMLLNGGYWEEELHEIFLDLWDTEGQALHLPVVDIGSNLGSFTLFAAALGSTVYSFEMQPMLFQLLNASVFASNYQRQVSLFNIGLWNRKENASFSPVFGNLGSTALKEGSDGKYIIQTSRFDEIVFEKYVYFMKIDVEGAEYEVLQGMDVLLSSKKILNLAIELKPGIKQEKCLRLLYSVGYKCKIYRKHCDRHCRGAISLPTCFFRSFRSAMVALTSIVKKQQRSGSLDMQGGDYFDLYCKLNYSRANII